MRKYWFVFSLYWQEGLTKRASFLMDRFRSLVVLISFYYLWMALLSGRPSFAGYDRSQMVTYLLGMNILRSLVFASQTDQIAFEINHGRLSVYLLRPVSFFIYTFFRDLSEKSTNLVSAIIEVMVLSLLFHMRIRWPATCATWVYFSASVIGAVLLYFLLSFIVGCWAFWTAESGGPRFLLELILEFTAGAFFPLDILPLSLQRVLAFFPSPYLVFFPLHVFLGKANRAEIISGFCTQLFWIGGLGTLAWWTWSAGVRAYGAEGS